MKKRSSSLVFVIVSVLTVNVLLTACNSQISAPTPTITLTPTFTPTATLTPTSTPTLRPTSTSTPTETLTPTPAPVGVPVKNEIYEITVIEARKIDPVDASGMIYSPKPGFLLFELGVKVKNLNPGSTAGIYWGFMSVIEKDGQSDLPLLGGYEAVGNGKKVKPGRLTLHELDILNEMVNFDEDVYLRLVYVIKANDSTTVMFSFLNAPMVEVTIK